MVTVSDLDAKALEVLEAIYEAGGEASTTEIKEYTGFEKRGVIHYRYEKLREAGLIETETGDPEGTKIPPTIATLTEAAQKEIRGGLFGEEEGTIVERMDRIERRHKTVLEELKSVQRDFEQWRFDPERDEEISAMELTARLREVSEKAEQIEEIHEEVDSIEELEEQVRDVQFSPELSGYDGRTGRGTHGAPRGDRGRRSVRPRSTANVGGAGRSGWRVGTGGRGRAPGRHRGRPEVGRRTPVGVRPAGEPRGSPGGADREPERVAAVGLFRGSALVALHWK